MIRKLALILAVVLSLVLSLDVGPRPAAGQSSSFRPLSSFYVLSGETVYFLDAANPPLGWKAMPIGSNDLPPVPASSLISLESGYAITDAGEGWIRNGASGWQSVGQVPGTVATRQSTWGALKARYH